LKKIVASKGIRPVVTTTGLHQRTCVFGTLTLKGKQLFRQSDKFNQQDTLLDYLKQVKKRLGKKVVKCTYRARPQQSNKVKEYLEKNKDSVRIFYLPKSSPEFNAVEEC
jgi:transposase